MDELTLLRKTRDDTREPTPTAIADGRAALLSHIAQASHVANAGNRYGKRRALPRLTWTAAGIAAAVTAVVVIGNVTLNSQSAYASGLLRAAASETTHYADLIPDSGQYLLAHTHARWADCDAKGCQPNDQTIDVYMPADPKAQWILYRDWGKQKGVTGTSIETLRAVDGRFYDPQNSCVNVNYADIPVDGAAAYSWIDAQYTGGSVSRDEDNFVRIRDLLRTGLVPAPQRAALLDALSRIPGVTATDDVANLDGVKGVAIGRTEPLRAGERQEIIIDPHTGLVIGERETVGTTIFGWGPNREVSLTAIETTVVNRAP